MYGAKVTDPLGSRQTLVPGSLCVDRLHPRRRRLRRRHRVARQHRARDPARDVRRPGRDRRQAGDHLPGEGARRRRQHPQHVARQHRDAHLPRPGRGQPHTRSGSVEHDDRRAQGRDREGGRRVDRRDLGRGEERSPSPPPTPAAPTCRPPTTWSSSTPCPPAPSRSRSTRAASGTRRPAPSPGPRPRRRPSARSRPAARSPLTYTVQVENPAVGGTTYTNTAKANTTSLGSDTTGVRSSTSTSTTAPDYAASANKTISVVLPVDHQGRHPDGGDHRRQRHLDRQGERCPANVRYWDTTVVDTVPDGLAVDSYGAITCTAGCPGTDPTVSTFPVTTSGATQQAAWFLGDLAPAAQQRTYELVLNGHVLSTKRAGGTVIGGTAAAPVSSPTRPGCAPTGPTPCPRRRPACRRRTPTPSGPATAATAIKEPRLVIDKSADKGPYVEGKDAVTYTVKVTNTGTWPAYDVVVTDQPDAELVDVTLVNGAALSTDGWTAGDPDLRWLIPGGDRSRRLGHLHLHDEGEAGDRARRPATRSPTRRRSRRTGASRRPPAPRTATTRGVSTSARSRP